MQNAVTREQRESMKLC